MIHPGYGKSAYGEWGGEWQHQMPMDPWGGNGKGCDWGKGMMDHGKGPYGFPMMGHGGPDFCKGGWFGGPGHGMKGGDFGKGCGFMKGKGNFHMKGCQVGKGCAKGFGKPGKQGEVEISEKIWVGGLPKDATAEEIQDFFSEFGPVQLVDVKTDKGGASRGFAFVTFESIDTAKVVLDKRALEFADHWLDCKAADAPSKGSKGKQAGKFGPSEEPVPLSEKIFINNLPPGTTEDALCFHFCQFGTVKSTALKHDPVSGVFRGFAFVVFDSVEDAQLVLDTPDAAEFEGKTLDIKPAVEKEGKGGVFGGKDSGGKGKGKGKDHPLTKIWVGCIPLSATEDHVREYFEHFGDVSEVTLEYDEMNLSRGFGHVNFLSSESAKTVLGHYGDDHFDPLEWEPGVLLDIKGVDATKRAADVAVTEKIFVGSLAKHLKQQEIMDFYSKFGPIKEVFMKCDSDGSFRGHCFITFRSVASAQKALDAGGMGYCKPFADAAREKANAGNPPPTTSVLKVSGLPSDPKSRDVFRFFYNFSVARIRDTGDDILIEFTSEAECKKAFEQKVGHKLGSTLASLSGATREEMAQAGEKMKSAQEPNKGVKGGYGPAPHGQGSYNSPY